MSPKENSENKKKKLFTMRIVLYFEREQEPLGNNQLNQLVLSMKNELNQNFITCNI